MTGFRSTETYGVVVFDRLKVHAGRSFPAKVCYDRCESGYDELNQMTHNWTRKQHELTDSKVILAAGAPEAWRSNPVAMANAAANAARAKRKDAQVAICGYIPLPRDLPADQRMAAVEDFLEPYVDTGSCAVISLHDAEASDGGRNVHAHVILTLDEIDPSKPHGFGRRNRTLDKDCFGGPAKIDAQREWWCEVVNKYLEKCGSERRADHRPYADRGDHRIAQQKEEIGAKAIKDRTGTLSDFQQENLAIIAHNTRVNVALEELRKTYTTIMEQPMINEKAPAATKAKILKQRFPQIDAQQFKNKLAWVSPNNNWGSTRVVLNDSTTIEARDGIVRQFGGPMKKPHPLAEHIRRHEEIEEDVQVLKRSAKIGKKGGGKKMTPKQAEARADEYRARGLYDVTVSRSSVIVSVGESRITDFGNKAVLDGPVTDEAIEVMVANAEKNYGGSVKIWGTEEFKQKYWLAARKRGLEVVGYEPPQWLRDELEKEQAAMRNGDMRQARQEGAAALVQSATADAQRVKRYALGEADTLDDEHLKRAIDAMSEAEKRALGDTKTARVITQLAALREAGAEIEPDDAPEPDRPTDDDEPKQDHTRGMGL